jgi:hypothetical protein
VFRAEPGKEDIVLRVASAYEAASKRRIPPPAFGPLVGEITCRDRLAGTDARCVRFRTLAPPFLPSPGRN